jgi:uncharacterized protein with HEPN domain
MSTATRPYLQHMLTETQYLMQQRQGLEKAVVLRDETLTRAFVRSLEIIGETGKQLPDAVKQRYGHLAWRAMAGMRDRLLHGYFGVAYDIVWDVVTNKIPELQQAVAHILRQEGPH